MSEAITKVCEQCQDSNYDPTIDGECPDCNGTGRVPDVEATLRAEVAALRVKLDKVTGQRDELREAATDHAEWHGGLCDNGDTCNAFSSGHRALCAVEARLAKALEAARFAEGAL